MTVHERPFGRCLEDFVVGDVYRHWPGKTITEYDDHLFCMITMNHHPLHTDAWFIVIIQNRWSSYSVIVLPGQCL